MTGTSSSGRSSSAPSCSEASSAPARSSGTCRTSAGRRRPSRSRPGRTFPRSRRSWRWTATWRGRASRSAASCSCAGVRGAAEARKEHATALGSSRAAWARYKALPASDDEKALRPSSRRFSRTGRRRLSRSRPPPRAGVGRRPEGRDRALHERGREEVREGAGALGKLADLRQKSAEAFAEQIRATSTRTTVMTIAVILALVASGVAAGLLFSRMIVGSLARRRRAGPARRGRRPRARIAAHGGDELGDMGASLNRMLETFEGVIIQVQHSTTQTAEASRQLASGSEQLSSGAGEQASSIEETSASLEQMSASITQNAENSRQMEQMARQGRAGRGARASEAVVARRVAGDEVASPRRSRSSRTSRTRRTCSR